MKKILTLFSVTILVLSMSAASFALNFTATMGDADYGADRDEYDVSANMDFLVYPDDKGRNGNAHNSLGLIAWEYEIPFEIEEALSGSMTVRAWDIDDQDDMNVFFNFGADRIFAGVLTGSNGGSEDDWENAVADGTADQLSGWSETTFSFDQSLLDAMSGSTGFSLAFDVQNYSAGWAAVIDYAAIDLEYTAVPEPSAIILLGVGLLLLVGFRIRFLQN